MTEQTPTLTFQELDSILQIIDSAPRDGEVKITVGEVTLEIATRSSTPAPAPTAAGAPAAQPAAVPAPGPSAVQPAVEAPSPSGVGAQAPAHAAKSAAVDDADLAGFIAVPAPMTGVFYSRPNPGADPFVAEGDTVVKGQDLAIVEVMKLMNRIGSPVDGIVRRICADNESLVEHGNALFYIEATGGAA